MRKLALTFIALLIILSAVAVWAIPLVVDGTCCDGCDRGEDGDCCQDFVCCHSAPIFALVYAHSLLPAADFVVSRDNPTTATFSSGQFDLSLDLPPRTIPC